jgi:cytochrome c biogenesis protein CcmG, thiol:disulfide interchange protein DsbE
VGRALKLTAQALSVLLVAGLLGLLVWKISHQGGGVASKLKNGHPVAAPGFSLSRLGKPGKLALASYRGRPVVLNFFASWCVPCAKESRTLEASWKRWQPAGVVVVGVDWQDFSGDAKRFVSKHGLTYPVVRTSSGDVVNAYGVTGVPETFFVDRRGRVVAHVAGPVSDDDLSAGIREALAE